MSPFVLSLAVTLVTAPVVRWVMLNRGIIDVPNHRSSHVIPTPRGGGLACLLGVVAAFSLAAISGVAVPWLAAGAAIALSLVGFADDRYNLSPLVRLGAQVGGGLLMGVAAGGGAFLLIGALIAPVVVNVVNFMDGINGITGLSVAVWGGTAWLVGLAIQADTLWVLGATTAGAAVGFLPWNIPAAKLFLGDVGSYLFGGLIAAGVVVGLSSEASPVALVSPLALYLADTGTVLLRRTHRGESLVEAHREHVYQRLVASGGLSHMTVASLVALSATLVTFAWLRATPLFAALLTLFLCTTYFLSPRLIKKPSNGVRSSNALG